MPRVGRAPFQLTPPCAALHSHPQADLVPQQIAVEPPEGAQFVELVENQLDGRSRLLIGIENYLTGG